jgi:hypothetical protein
MRRRRMHDSDAPSWRKIPRRSAAMTVRQDCWLTRVLTGAQANSCARNCARMTTFLLVRRKRDADRGKLRLPLVNRSFFETKRNAVKSTISES